MKSLRMNVIYCAGAICFLLFTGSVHRGVAQNTFPSSGNAGVGTSSPEQLFDIYSAGADPYTMLQIRANRSGYGNVRGRIEVYAGGSTTTDKMFFGTDSSTASARMLTLRGDGNVGIGTTGPSVKLDVSGTITSNNSLTNPPSTGATHGTSLGFDANLEIGWLQSARANTSAPELRAFVLNPLGGNVGIGTTMPSVKLDVSGTITSNNSLTNPPSTGATHGTSLGFDANLEIGWIQSARANTSASELRALVLNPLGGNVGIGTTLPTEKLHVVGNGKITGDLIVGGNIAAKYQDVAEWVPASEQLPVATVVVLDTSKSNQVTLSTQAYDTRVAGVISEQPGITLGEKNDNKVLVATTGRVKVKVDATKSPIQIGDLLVTSDVPGMAMKSEPIKVGGRLLHMPGTLIGKALEPLEKGSGKILVLLSLQ